MPEGVGTWGSMYVVRGTSGHDDSDIARHAGCDCRSSFRTDARLDFVP